MLACVYFFTDASAVATFSNEACTTGGVKPTESLLFTCEIYESMFLRIRLPNGHQELLTVGSTVADVNLPAGYTAVLLNITEINESLRNLSLTLFITNASLLNDSEILCDDSTPMKRVVARCPIGKLRPTHASIKPVTMREQLTLYQPS